MGILTSLTRELIRGSFDLLGGYIDKKRQESQDEKAFKLLFEHLAKQPGWSQGGILPFYDMLSSRQAGKRGVLPTESYFPMSFGGMDDPRNSDNKRRRPFVDYSTGETYFPLMGPGNLYQDSNGNIIRPSDQ